MPGVAILLVDIQNDFLPPGGSLAVNSGLEIIPPVHRLLADPSRFGLIVATKVRRVLGLQMKRKFTRDAMRSTGL